MNRILVTGSKGLIGSALRAQIEGHGREVVGLDLRGAGSEKGDVRDAQRIRGLIDRCLGVIHLAAVSRVAWAERDQEGCWSSNVGGLRNIIEALEAADRQTQRPWLVFASSREVYGQPDQLPATEDTPLRPINVYGRSKVEGERLVNEAIGRGLRAATVRLSNVYGSVDDHADRVIPAFARAAVSGTTLRVDGAECAFDFTHIDDTIPGDGCNHRSVGERAGASANPSDDGSTDHSRRPRGNGLGVLGRQGLSRPSRAAILRHHPFSRRSIASPENCWAGRRALLSGRVLQGLWETSALSPTLSNARRLRHEDSSTSFARVQCLTTQANSACIFQVFNASASVVSSTNWGTMSPGQYRNLFDLSGRVAVVTGGVGILGRCFCAALADAGGSIAVVDLDRNECESFASELSVTFGVSCFGIAADISDPDSVRDMADRVEDQLGDASILHNNAASKGGDPAAFFDSVEDFSLEVWREIMAVNLDGQFLVAREFGERMAKRGGGSIIQTASIYGVMAPDQRIYEGSVYKGMPINTPAVYSASKAGVIGLSRYLATWWADKGVRVNVLTPGGVASGQNDVFQRRYSDRVPLRRMARPDEMAGALLFLASDASSYVTGQNIIVDGGLSAW